MSDTNNIVLGRAGKDAARKAVMQHPSWPRYAADNGVTGKPDKATMIDFADHTELDLQAIADAANAAAKGEVNKSEDVRIERKIEAAAAAPAKAAPVKPSAGDVPPTVDLVTTALADVAPVLAESMLDKLRAAVGDAIDKSARDAAAKAAKAIAAAPAVTGAGGRVRHVASRVRQAPVSGIFDCGAPDMLPDVSAWIWDAPDAPAVKPEYVFEPNRTAQIVYALENGEHVWLAGPSSAGKSSLAAQIGARLHRPVVVIEFNRRTDPAALTGSLALDGKGGTTFQRGAFVDGVTRDAALVVFEEFDFCPPATAGVVQTWIEERAVTIPETGEVIPFADGVQIIVCANTGGSGDASGLYAGTIEQNAAMMRRFGTVIPVTYLDEKTERAALAKTLGITQRAARPFTEFAKVTRDDLTTGGNGDAVCFRMTRDFAKRVRDGWNVQTAFNMAVLNKMKPDFAERVGQLFTANFDIAAAVKAMNGGDASEAQTAAPEAAPSGALASDELADAAAVLNA